ncbi:MAG TPA: hypothetical protein VJV23_09970 [Candidatus Polarisedimenticolia bacterium]|nr:hypothetical protein [Candidatus Polarisedimenticolia bacterium]
MRSRSLSRLLALGALLPWLAAPPLPAARPYRIAGLERDDKGKWVPAEVLRQSRDGVTAEIKFLDPDARRAVVRAALGGEGNVFPGRAGEKAPGFLVFVLQLANGSRHDVTFNPGQARLTTEKGDMKFALDYSAVHELTRGLGEGSPGMDDLSAILFDRVVTIRPEGSVRKLLAFPAPREDRYKEIQVRIVELNVGSDGIDLIFPFRKVSP